MHSPKPLFLAPRLATFLLWSLAAASAVFWVLQNWNPSATTTSTDGSVIKAQLASTAEPAPDLTPQVAAALGAKNATALTPAAEMTALQARLQLQGVLAVGTARGAALISVDSKPAKPYRVGSAIESDLEVISVAPREASIGKAGQAAFTLTLPTKN